MSVAPLMPQKTYVIDKTLEAQGRPVRPHAYLTTNGQLRGLAGMARLP
ncbi:MAG TPA: hypothetical protein VN673_00565 [Clostridia bacterium]|nr:hypothetical protein [Clostridia bacterium]